MGTHSFEINENGRKNVNSTLNAVAMAMLDVLDNPKFEGLPLKTYRAAEEVLNFAAGLKMSLRKLTHETHRVNNRIAMREAGISGRR